MNRTNAEDTATQKLKLFLLSSIRDQFEVNRICRCLYKGNISLHTIFTARYLYDKFYERLNVKGLSLNGTFREQDCVRYVENKYLIFICCTIIASKGYMDMSYTNLSWTEICHFPVVHINKTEKIILNVIDFDIIVPLALMEQLYFEYGCSDEIYKIKNEVPRKKTNFFRRVLSRTLKLFTCVRGD